MQVHRIENPQDNEGPFRSEVLYGIFGEAISPAIQKFWNFANKNLPTPAEEADQEGKHEDLIRIVPVPAMAKFGSETHQALMTWVPKPALKELKRLGFVERVYEVPDTDALALKSQIIYRHESAKLLSEQPLEA